MQEDAFGTLLQEEPVVPTPHLLVIVYLVVVTHSTTFYFNLATSALASAISSSSALVFTLVWSHKHVLYKHLTWKGKENYLKIYINLRIHATWIGKLSKRHAQPTSNATLRSLSACNYSCNLETYSHLKVKRHKRSRRCN